MKLSLLSHLSHIQPGNLHETRQRAQGFPLWQWHLSDGFLHILIIVIFLLNPLYLIFRWIIRSNIWIDDTRSHFSPNTFDLVTFEYKKFHSSVYGSFHQTSIFVVVWQKKYKRILIHVFAFGFLRFELSISIVWKHNVQTMKTWLRLFWQGPAQNAPFFYTPSHLSELQSFKSIISTIFPFIFIFK